ncbi:MAG: glycosyltransferase family 39 protein [Rhizomicrobium sp.]|jgi:hypothetical protein
MTQAGNTISRSSPAPAQTPGIQPAQGVALLVVAQVAIWTIVPWLSGRSLPLDVVSDGLAWGHEWQWGYFKHPPLPSWEVEVFFDALGDIGPYLLSQVTVALTYVFVFLLGKKLMPARWAAAGTLLTACVYYFSIPTPEFNHNVAQMPLWAAAVYAYHGAISERRLRWWVMLGVTCGLALLTKYASGILIIVLLGHVLIDAQRRAILRSSGPYLAAAMCLMVVSPHVVWLVHNHFPTLSYAQQRAGESHGVIQRIVTPFRFLLTQLLDISPAIASAAIAGFLGRESLRRTEPDQTLRFLLWFAVGPAALTAALSLIAGVGLRDMWAAPMWSLTGLTIVYACRNSWPNVSWRRLSACMCAIFIFMPLTYVFATSIVPARQGKPSRLQWPDREMASTLASAYFREAGKPVHIVAGDGWLAGLIAMRLSWRPSVLTDGDVRESPWITAERLAQQGALVVWRDGSFPRRLLAIKGLRMVGKTVFTWPDVPKAKPLVIRWGIVPPQSASSGSQNS